MAKILVKTATKEKCEEKCKEALVKLSKLVINIGLHNKIGSEQRKVPEFKEKGEY